MFRNMKMMYVILTVLTFLPGQGFAEATTQDEVVATKLLQGWQTDSGGTMMAVGLTLTPGWKTYWRSPGDAGIPPSFDWSGSTNLSQVRIHWPRPEVFVVSGMTSIGYHDKLVLPVELFPIDPAQPIGLSLRMDIGICKDICLPASLTMDGTVVADNTDGAEIKTALAEQPQAAKAAGLSAMWCEISPVSDGLKVTAHLDMPPLGPDETVVFEAGQPEIWVAPAESARQGKTLIAMTEMVGATGAPFALDRSGVVLTVISGQSAVEIRGCPAGK